MLREVWRRIYLNYDYQIKLFLRGYNILASLSDLPNRPVKHSNYVKNRKIYTNIVIPMHETAQLSTLVVV